MSYNESSIVIDNGSEMTKAGFAGDVPLSVFPSVVGRRRLANFVPKDQMDCYIGQEAIDRKQTVWSKYPVEEGIITNWDDMEKLWHHTFYNELRVNPVDHPVILSEPTPNPRANREIMAVIMFETFNCPSLCLVADCVLALRSAERETGLCVDAGASGTRVIPVENGRPVRDAIMRTLFGGRELSSWLRSLLSMERNDTEILDDVKARHCYVALDFEAELSKTITPINYSLPDGRVIDITTERFRCPELLFNPSLNRHEHNGIANHVVDTVARCNSDLQPSLLSNIVCTGGTSMFAGFGLRLEKEISALVTHEVKVIAPDDRAYAVWAGGSLIGDSELFSKKAIMSSEYDEYGPAIVHTK